MRSPVATRTTPAERCGCRYQKRESCRHDWFDEASRAIREKIEDKGSGRSSGKHAHVVTCTSPLQRTSEPSKIRRPPRTRTWVARQSTCDAHRQRCTTPASMETTDRHLCTCRLLIGQIHPPPEWWTDTTGHGRGIKEETWTARGSWYASNVA